MFLTDTHSHILPGMDDGALTFDQSLDFVRLAEKEGVSTIFATPHCCDGVYNCDKGAILNACSCLSDNLSKEAVNIKVVPGAEIRLNHDLISLLDKGYLLTLANTGNFILLELPPMFIEQAVFMILQQLRDRGITPVIAHPERNPMILKRLSLVADFINNGALMQLTAGSLCGDFGKQAFKAARAFVKADQFFCLGSDIHPGRKYRMADARKIVKKMIGSKKTEKLFQENPELILTKYELKKTADRK